MHVHRMRIPKNHRAPGQCQHCGHRVRVSLRSLSPDQ